MIVVARYPEVHPSPSMICTCIMFNEEFHTDRNRQREKADFGTCVCTYACTCSRHVCMLDCG